VARASAARCRLKAASRRWPDLYPGINGTGVEYCLERGLDAWRFEILAPQARRLLDQGHCTSCLPPLHPPRSRGSRAAQRPPTLWSACCEAHRFSGSDCPGTDRDTAGAAAAWMEFGCQYEGAITRCTEDRARIAGAHSTSSRHVTRDRSPRSQRAPPWLSRAEALSTGDEARADALGQLVHFCGTDPLVGRPLCQFKDPDASSVFRGPRDDVHMKVLETILLGEK